MDNIFRFFQFILHFTFFRFLPASTRTGGIYIKKFNLRGIYHEDE